jgi:hypothetical protein
MTSLQFGPRKRQVAELLCTEGCQNPEIARRLGVPVWLVKALMRGPVPPDSTRPSLFKTCPVGALATR